MESIIRKAKEQDVQEILRLLRQVNQIHADGRPDLFKSGGIKYTTAELAALLADEGRATFVCVEGERVLGYVFGVLEYTQETTSLYGHKSMYIDDLCVDAPARGRQVGRRLYEHLCAFAREHGCDRVTLHVWECNPGARQFYEKLGMQPLYTTMEQPL